jgi:hypothetical protein
MDLASSSETIQCEAAVRRLKIDPGDSSFREVLFPTAFPRNGTTVCLALPLLGPDACRFSQPLDAYPSQSLPAMFQTEIRSWVSPFRALLSPQSSRSSSDVLTLVRLAALRDESISKEMLRTDRPPLQGFDPCEDPPLRGKGFRLASSV